MPDPQLRTSTPLTTPTINFIMEVEKDKMLSFLGTQHLNQVPCILTEVFVKPTNSGLPLHFHSHFDNRYLTEERERSLYSLDWSIPSTL